MKGYIEQRVKDIAEHIMGTDETLRETAKHFGVNKSTVHKDMKERLPNLYPQLAGQIEEIMNRHIQTRHIRGGEATKEKYIKKNTQDKMIHG